MVLVNITDVCMNLNFWKSSIPQMLDCTPGGPYVHVLLQILFAALLFYILTRAADNFLCPSLVEVSKSLSLSESLAGVTLVAFGNGAPDVFSAFSAIRRSRSSMVFAELFGSSAFVSALVAGIVMIVAPSFIVDWTTFSRNMLFFLGGSAYTFYVFYRGTIHLLEAATFVIIYLVYIVVVGACTGCSDARKSHDEEGMKRASSRNSIKTPEFSSGSNFTENSNSTDEHAPFSAMLDLAQHISPWSFKKFPEMSFFTKIRKIILFPVDFALILTVPVMDTNAQRANWCKILNTMHCVVTPPVTVLLFFGDIRVYGVPLSVCILPPSFLLGLVVLSTSRMAKAPNYHVAFALLGFLASAGWIFCTCEVLVETLSAIGETLRIPESIMGLTVLSWGNSLGDLVTNIAIAKHGYASMAISATFGGILVDMLLGLGLPYSYRLLTMEEHDILLDWSYAVVPLFAGVVSFIAVASASLWYNKWRTSRTHGFIFISIYAVTVVASCAVSANEGAINHFT